MRLTIQPAAGLRGSISIPGDKSISHRAAVLAALADGASRISGWLPSGDCWATVNGLRALGVQIEVLNGAETSADLLVQGVGLNGFKDPTGPLNCQGSGTTIRLLAGLLAGQPLNVALDGHNGLRRRPMERVARPLRRMGAHIQTTDGRAPLRVQGGRLQGIEFEMPIPSGQVKSAVLLAALFSESPIVIHQPGPVRDHLERMLNARGVQVEVTGNTIKSPAGVAKISPLDVEIPADFSSAAFPLVAAVLASESEVTLTRVNVNETRTGLLDVLREMQADVTLFDHDEAHGEPLAGISARSSALRGMVIQGDTVVRMIDEFPILAVAATQARGRTVVRDATELRLKETGRIKATVEELRKMGAQMIACPDGFEVHGPTRLKGAIVDSQGDHRLAMALAVAGLIAQGQTTITNAAVIADSYPGFSRMLSQIGARVELA